MSEISSKKAETETKDSKEEISNLKKLLYDNKKHNYKTTISGKSNKSRSNNNSTTDIINNFRTFKGYLNSISIYYEKEFRTKENIEQLKKETNYIIKDNLDIKNIFQKTMPYISGTKEIKLSSIQIPDNQFFENIFKDIINSFEGNNAFPGENKCGLSYFDSTEWIYFTIEEVFFQRYILDTNKVMTKLYQDFMNSNIEEDSLFTENDQYILPSSVSGYNFERNATKFFGIKSEKLKALPDLLIKLDAKKGNFKFNPQGEYTFDEYFGYITYNFVEIDGAFMNNTNEEIKIENNENAMKLYEKIIVNSKSYKKDDKKSDVEYTVSLSGYSDIIKIPNKTIIIFQTKLKCPFIQLDNKKLEVFENQKLSFRKMKKELAVVLKKMIQQGNYFWNLYNQIKLIDKNYNLLFFFIFDNFPINDISQYIKSYLELLILKKEVLYPFSILPIYMNSSLDFINNKLDVDKRINKINKLRDKDSKIIEELRKNRAEDSKKIEDYSKIIEDLRKNRIEDSKKIEDLQNKMKEMENKFNEKMNNPMLKNTNLFQIKDCDEKTKNLVTEIKTQVETSMGTKLPIYEPVGFKSELKDDKENYVIKVHIGNQKYIHIYVSKKVITEEVGKVIVLLGLRLNDPL